MRRSAAVAVRRDQRLREARARTASPECIGRARSSSRRCRPHRPAWRCRSAPIGPRRPSSARTGRPRSASTGTCCRRYDQRGRARSADGVRPADVTVDSEMDDLDRVRRHLELESVAVLGHSWGGVLAMEYASRHPERLTHLVLLNTAPASHADVQVFRRHLRRIRPPGDVQAMQSLAATTEFRAGNLDVESEYYRIHYRPAVHAPRLLDRLLPRLRKNVTPERVLTARAIEDRLYDPDLVIPRIRPAPEAASPRCADARPARRGRLRSDRGGGARCPGDPRGPTRRGAPMRPLRVPGGTRRRGAASPRAVRQPTECTPP